MKKLVYIPLVFVCLLVACKKEKENDVLTGTWRLTEVYDKANSTTIPEPSGLARGVVITFSNGDFQGHTVANTIWDGSYTLAASNKITFGAYASTDALEESWGGKFCTVLGICLPQSSSICVPSSFTINGNILKINTISNYDVTLVKQ